MDEDEVLELAKQLSYSRTGLDLSKITDHARQELVEEARKILKEREEAQDKPLTRFDSEFEDWLALFRIILNYGVPADLAKEVSGNPSTVEQAAEGSAKMMNLATEYGIPRDWLLKEMQKKKWRKY